jgi:hypothetical protein
MAALLTHWLKALFGNGCKSSGAKKHFLMPNLNFIPIFFFFYQTQRRLFWFGNTHFGPPLHFQTYPSKYLEI